MGVVFATGGVVFVVESGRGRSPDCDVGRGHWCLSMWKRTWVEYGVFAGGLWWTVVVVVGEVSVSVGDFSGVLIVSGCDVGCC